MKYLLNIRLPLNSKVSIFSLYRKKEFLVLKNKNYLSTNFLQIPCQMMVSMNKKKNFFIFYSLKKKTDLNILNIISKTIKQSIIFAMLPAARELKISGFGFKTYLSKSTKTLGLKLGYSHKFYILANKLRKFYKQERYSINIFSNSTYLAGKLAADVQKFKKPDAYKGKGVHLPGKRIKLKVSKKSQER